MLTRGGICVPPTVTYLPYRVSGSTLTAGGRSQLLVRWPGTLSRILSGIQRAAQTVLGVSTQNLLVRAILVHASSALGVLTIMRYTNPRTHSLLSQYRLYSHSPACCSATDRQHLNSTTHTSSLSASKPTCRARLADEMNNSYSRGNARTKSRPADRRIIRQYSVVDCVTRYIDVSSRCGVMT